MPAKLKIIRTYYDEDLPIPVDVDGSAMCPVCGEKWAADVWPYDDGGGASFVICHSCGTEFGLHDCMDYRQEALDVRLWRLRAEWLKKEQWSTWALSQLTQVFGFDEATIRQQVGQLGP